MATNEFVCKHGFLSDGDSIIYGTDRYLNFGTTTGSGGYGFRDNSGIIEWKNNNGIWASVSGIADDIVFRENDYSSIYGGAYAGAALTTGEKNFLAGYAAGYVLTEGHHNCFILNQAGDATTNGDYNIGIGSGALTDNTTGNGSIALGAEAAGSSNASYTIAIGHQAGKNSTGAGSTFLGYQAGFSVIGGGGNLFLGYQAGYNETGSNKLYISNSNTTTPLIYGEFDNNIVKINGDILPSASGTRDLGSAALPFKDLYMTGNSLYVGGEEINFSNYATTNASTIFNQSVTMNGDLTVASGGIAIGVDDTNRGILTLYGHATGTTEGGELRMYNSADWDSGAQYWNLGPNGDDLYIGRLGDAAMFTFTNTSDFYMNKGGELRVYASGGSLLGMRVIPGSGNVEVGDEDDQAGTVQCYGAAVDTGGSFIVSTAANSDSVISYYVFRAEQDDLYIGPSTDTDALKFAGDTSNWIFTGNILPSASGTYDLGSSSMPFQSIYAGTLYGDGSNLTGVGGVTDHGALTGLTDDDHTQYLLADGTRSLSGNLLPSASGTIDIGSSSFPFRDLYLTGSSLNLGTLIIEDDAGDLKITGGLDVTGSMTISGTLPFHTHIESDITDLGTYATYSELVTTSGDLQTQIDDTNIMIGTVSGSLQSQIDGKTDLGHTHVEADIVDLDKYTTAEVDALVSDVTASGVTGWFDDGFNFRVFITDGIITGISTTISGGFLLI